MRVEQWIFDCPDQAAAALAQFVKWFHQENRLAAARCDWPPHGQAGKHRAAVLNIYAMQDRLCAGASIPLQRLIGSTDYTAFASIRAYRIFVSRRADQEVPRRIVNGFERAILTHDIKPCSAIAWMELSANSVVREAAPC